MCSGLKDKYKNSMTTTELKAKIEAAALLALADYATEYGKDAPGTYFYGIKDEQNMQYDKPMPQIYCDPIRDRINPGTGLIEWPNIALVFVDLDTEDSIEPVRTDLLNRMDWLSLRFLKYFMVDDDDLQDDGIVTRDDLLKFGMGRVSGKVVQLPALRSNDPIC